MRKNPRIILFGLLIIVSIASMVTPVKYLAESTVILEDNERPATGEISTNYYPFDIEVDIEHAYYYDLDNDNFEDDILTIAELKTKAYGNYMISDVYQYITLPSGKTYYFVVRIIGWFDEINLISSWYNIATESGWYIYEIEIETYFYGYIYYDYDAVIFDPPEEGPIGGMPGVIIEIS